MFPDDGTSHTFLSTRTKSGLGCAVSISGRFALNINTMTINVAAKSTEINMDLNDILIFPEKFVKII